VDGPQIAIVKLLHRPVMSVVNCRLRSGCSCGDDRWPCPTLANALDAEQRNADTERNAGPYR
jgi:hypothetical protein